MNNKLEVIEFIKELFIEKDLINEISACPVIELHEGHFLLKEGDYVNAVPLVVTGTIKVIRNDESGKEILMYNIEKAESCALSISACLTNSKSKAVAQVEENAVIILISDSNLKKWIEKYPGFKTYIFKLFNSRFNELINVFDGIAFKNIDSRLIENLKEKSLHQKTDIIEITHQQLANELGTAREVISRLMKQLERQGKIESHRGKIKILSLM